MPISCRTTFSFCTNRQTILSESFDDSKSFDFSVCFQMIPNDLPKVFKRFGGFTLPGIVYRQTICNTSCGCSTISLLPSPASMSRHARAHRATRDSTSGGSCIHSDPGRSQCMSVVDDLHAHIYAHANIDTSVLLNKSHSPVEQNHEQTTTKQTNCCWNNLVVGITWLLE